MKLNKLFKVAICALSIGILGSCGLPDDPYLFPVEFYFDSVGDQLYKSVNNDISTFDFNDVVYTNYDWYIQQYQKNRLVKIKPVVDLAIGTNTFVLNIQTETLLTYTVNIRRLPMYDVLFDTNGGSEVNSIKVQEGSLIKLEDITTPSRFGYEFVCWEYNDTSFDFENTRINSSITLKACWRNDKYIIVTYDNNGTSGTIDRELLDVTKTNSQFNGGLNFSKTNATLKEWNTKKDGSGTKYNLGENVYGYTPCEITVYAIYEDLHLVWDGTKEAPVAKDGEFYLIRKASELAGLDLIEGNNVSAKLMYDFDLNGDNYSWTPLFKNKNAIGLIDGSNHTIKNMKIKNPVCEESKEYIGFVSKINGSFKDLKLIDSSIDVVVDTTNTDLYCGTLAGKIESNISSISNVVIDSDINVKSKRYTYIGAVAGDIATDNRNNEVKVNKVVSYGNIEFECDGSTTVGGLFGSSQSFDFIDSYTFTNIKGKVNNGSNYQIGGLVGFCGRLSHDFYFKNCVALNNIEVEATNYKNVGPFFGGIFFENEYLSGQIYFENNYYLSTATYKYNNNVIDDNNLFKYNETKATLEYIKSHINYEIVNN